MFGGLAFLVNGNMAIAASGQGEILVRSDPRKAMPPRAEPAIMRGRPMDGWLRVSDDQLKTKTQLGKWAQIDSFRLSPPQKLTETSPDIPCLQCPNTPDERIPIAADLATGQSPDLPGSLTTAM